MIFLSGALVWMTIVWTEWKLTRAYMDRPRPFNTNFGESLLYYTATAEEIAVQQLNLHSSVSS